MKKEYHERKRTGEKCERVILYIHGGAYYFGSVDEHRYQMQRHARKLKARLLSPRYRLAPQFPFPCGLYDCLATYYYLLEHFDPSQILFAGDSAGGGMVLCMLVTLRDQGQPLPAGTILLSPWVDLTHSFPSVAGDGVGDYIPPHGFHHKPSMAWPPPPEDEIKKPSGNYGQPSNAVELPATLGLDMKRRKKGAEDEDAQSISTVAQSKKAESITALPSTLPAFGHDLSIILDGQMIKMRDQIQMYTTNQLLAHPLVSPVMQPSLGGLPPMLIQVGDAELLKDEQVYIAHKAANPKAYPSNDTIMDEFDPQRRTLERYPPTDVQLQVWEDLCHVPHTLSFTRPAKYMYRSVAQFGAWALAHAQHKDVDIENEDAVSIISSGDEEEEGDDTNSIAESSKQGAKDIETMSTNKLKLAVLGAVGKAGDPIPPFKDHMIRQRVTRHGVIFALPPPSEMASLALDPASIGVIKTGPVRKWLAVKIANDQRFANDKKKILKKRAKELSAGYDEIPGECAPPTALVNRRRKGVAPEEKKKGKSWGLAMWSGWGSSHDEHTLQREQKTTEARKEGFANGAAAKSSSDLLSTQTADAEKKKQRRTSSASMFSSQMPWTKEKERPRSPFMGVRDTGQADQARQNSSPAPSAARSAFTRRTSATSSLVNLTRPVSIGGTDSPIPVEQDCAREPEGPIPTTSAIAPNSEKIPGSNNTYLSPTSSRPHNGFQSYPFKLREQASNPSMVTLDSVVPGGASTPASGAHSELAGDRPAPVELPSAADSREHVESEAADVAIATAAAALVAPAAESVQQNASNSTPSRLPRAETAGPESGVVSPIEGPTSGAKDGLVSPIETPAMQTPPPFRLRNTIFDPRTSMLGSIGADGMPNAHHDFPIRHTIHEAQLSTRSSTDELVPLVPSANADKDENEKCEDEIVDEAKPAPLFKVRNPVKDSRVATNGQTSENMAPAATATKDVVKPTEPTTAAASTREAIKPSDAIKAAPFKLRHTVYEPSVTLAKGQASEDFFPMSLNPAGKQVEQATSPSADLPPPSGSSASSNDQPPAYDSMPLTNIVMPETVATRPIVRQRTPLRDGGEDKPPTPPPKDDKPHFFNKKSSEKMSSAATKRIGPANKNGLPLSKFSGGTKPPLIGDLSFERKGGDGKERPPLDSFVTASEGRVQKG